MNNEQLHTDKHLSDDELIDIYGCAELETYLQSALKQGLKDRNQLLKIRRRFIKHVRKVFKKGCPGRTYWFECLKALTHKPLAQLESKLETVAKLLSIIQNLQLPKHSGGITQDDIYRAKRVSIHKLYSGNLKKSGANYQALCIFHREHTPSLYIYPKENSFHCFGCNSHGDSIEFVKRAYDLNFVDAVKFLINHE